MEIGLSQPPPERSRTSGFPLLTRGAGGTLYLKWWVRRPTTFGRTIRMAAALSRGALRWIRLPALKRAVWVCFQAARVLTPPPELYDREGVFCGMPLFS
jgi:hypothetical protein